MNVSISHNVVKNTRPCYTDYDKLFDTLYAEHSPKAYGFILKYAKSRKEAEDILATIFLKVWEDIENFKEDADKKILRIILITCRPLFKTINIKPLNM